MNIIRSIASIALACAVARAAPVKLCVTHSQTQRDQIVESLTLRGFEIDPRPVVQIGMGRDPDLRMGTPAFQAAWDRIESLEPGCDAYINWEYLDHYANAAPNTRLQTATKITLASAIRAKGCRAGIYAPVVVRANALTNTSQTSIENLRIIGRFVDFVVIPVYIATPFEPGDPEHVRYMLNTLATIIDARAVLPDSVEIMLAFQFSVRPSGTTRATMTEYQAATMGRLIAASRCTGMWWFEQREGNRDAIESRLGEVDALGSKFLTGLSRHRVAMNADAGGPQGSD